MYSIFLEATGSRDMISPTCRGYFSKGKAFRSTRKEREKRIRRRRIYSPNRSPLFLPFIQPTPRAYAVSSPRRALRFSSLLSSSRTKGSGILSLIFPRDRLHFSRACLLKKKERKKEREKERGKGMKRRKLAHRAKKELWMYVFRRFVTREGGEGRGKRILGGKKEGGFRREGGRETFAIGPGRGG